ncbi:hypothetical protein FKP32DRAFT_1597177 [Trametes sanguinea]|nr:hypothetical protein FKP32DRAFT_1597177 [Trametes sanguinea]
MSALPSVSEAAEILPRDASTALNLYELLILPAEKAALDRLGCDNANTRTVAPSVVYARVVGYLLLYPPSDVARSAVTEDIASCRSPDQQDAFNALYELGAMYTKQFIVLFRSARGKTPTPSDHPSRASFDRLQTDNPQAPQPSPRDHSSAKKSALVRDNYRCMLSHKVDELSERAGLTRRLPNEQFAATQCCHIIPDALGNVSCERTGNNEHAPASVWTILGRFGYRDVCEELGGATAGTNLHRLENVLTLEQLAHTLFDRLDLWFEEMEGEPHVYRVGLVPSRTPADFGYPDRVRFESHRPGLALPSPRYLKLHAACCRLAHLSGAAEYVDLLFREMEESGVLAEDGASADVLAYALHRRLAELVELS